VQQAVLDKAATEVSNTTAASDAPPHFGFNISKLEQARHSKTFWAVEPPLPIAEPPRHQQLLRNSRFVPLCFDNGEACFRDVATSDLVRSISVFTVCGWTWLVKRADTLYAWSVRLLGWTRIPQTVVRHSFFAHFCAGEDQEVRSIQVFGLVVLISGNVPRLSQRHHGSHVWSVSWCLPATNTFDSCLSAARSVLLYAAHSLWRCP
jgi:hypothetical protein